MEPELQNTEVGPNLLSAPVGTIFIGILCGLAPYKAQDVSSPSVRSSIRLSAITYGDFTQKAYRK